MKIHIWAVSIVLFVSVFGCSGLAEKNGSSASLTRGGPVLWLDSTNIELRLDGIGEVL